MAKTTEYAATKNAINFKALFLVLLFAVVGTVVIAGSQAAPQEPTDQIDENSTAAQFNILGDHLVFEGAEWGPSQTQNTLVSLNSGTPQETYIKVEGQRVQTLLTENNSAKVNNFYRSTLIALGYLEQDSIGPNSAVPWVATYQKENHHIEIQYYASPDGWLLQLFEGMIPTT